MNIIFNNDMERIYLSSEYMFLKENEADAVHFKTFEDFWYNFNKNTYIIGTSDDEFKQKLKEKAENIYNIFTQSKNKKETEMNMSMNHELLELILNTCKDNDIKIITPYRILDGGKVGTEANFQLNIMKHHYLEKYSVNLSFGGDFEKALTKIDAIKTFENILIDKAKNKDIQFVQLVMPRRAVEFAEMVDIQDVIIRHLIDYWPNSDLLIDRWDVLIKLHDKVN